MSHSIDPKSENSRLREGLLREIRGVLDFIPVILERMQQLQLVCRNLSEDGEAERGSVDWNRCALTGTVLIVGPTFVDLSARPLMLKLFRLFLEDSSQVLGRDDLVRELYAVGRSCERSERWMAASSHNAVKLVCRARELLAGAVDPQIVDRWDWFVYVPEKKHWVLRAPKS